MSGVATVLLPPVPGSEYPNLGCFRRGHTLVLVSPKPLHRSAIALLHRLESEGLPSILTDPEDIMSVSALVQAGHLKAVMQVVFDPLGGGPQIGVVVSEVTASGSGTIRDVGLE